MPPSVEGQPGDTGAAGRLGGWAAPWCHGCPKGSSGHPAPAPCPGRKAVSAQLAWADGDAWAWLGLGDCWPILLAAQGSGELGLA